MDLTKEEILGNIQRLSQQRRERFATSRSLQEELKDRDRDLPAWESVVEAVKTVKLIGAKLGEQRDNDKTWLGIKEKLDDSNHTLSTIEDSLSEMLLLYQIKTQKKSVHADPEQPAAIDQEIKTTARLGKKVAANLSLFDEDDDDKST